LGIFQQTIGQGAFAVVDMCYNTKISDILHLIFADFRRAIVNRRIAVQSAKIVNFGEILVNILSKYGNSVFAKRNKQKRLACSNGQFCEMAALHFYK